MRSVKPVCSQGDDRIASSEQLLERRSADSFVRENSCTSPKLADKASLSQNLVLGGTSYTSP